MTEQTINLVLPIPVSFNKAYANVSKVGRVKSTDAKLWWRDAMHFAVPFIRDHADVCNRNVLTRRRYMGPKGTVVLQRLKADYPILGYAVTYTYHFSNDSIRDIFNFEKMLTDLLVECGFMLDDNFIIDGRVKWGKINSVTPHVEIQIISLDRTAVI